MSKIPMFHPEATDVDEYKIILHVETLIDGDVVCLWRVANGDAEAPFGKAQAGDEVGAYALALTQLHEGLMGYLGHEVRSLGMDYLEPESAPAEPEPDEEDDDDEGYAEAAAQVTSKYSPETFRLGGQ